MAVNRVRSFLLCKDHEAVGPGDLDDIGVRMRNVSAAYDSKRPIMEGLEPDSETKKLLDAQWEVELLRLQLEDAEKRIRESSSAADTVSTDMMMASEHGSATEESVGSGLLCLKRIDFDCKPGELVAVVGGVGCGKSSLINAIFGEVRELSGTIRIKGRLAYFARKSIRLKNTHGLSLEITHSLDRCRNSFHS